MLNAKIIVWLLAPALLLMPRGAPAESVRGQVIEQGTDRPLGQVALLFDSVSASPPRRGNTRRRPEVRLNEAWLSFWPKVQVVPTGTRLIASNQDDEAHTVHAVWQGQTLFHFASVPGEPDQSVVLNRPGLVTISCEMHGEMHAFILVDDAPSVVTAGDGGFALDLPRGRYGVRGWQPGVEARPGHPGRLLSLITVPTPVPLVVRFPKLATANARSPK